MKELIILCLLHANTGDNANVLGVANNFAQEYQIPANKIHILKVYNELPKSPDEKKANIDRLIDEVKNIATSQPYSHLIAIGAGNEGYESLLAIKKLDTDGNMFVSWSGHHCYEFLNSPEASALDLVALPTYALSDEQRVSFKKRGIKLVEIRSVSHNTTKKVLEESYNHWRSRIKVMPRYLAIILAGDVPVENGSILYFTEAEAEQLAEYVAETANRNQQFVLVTCAPRTGKFDAKTGKARIDIHKEGAKPDPVSMAFIRRLAARLVDKDRGYQFFDFKTLNNQTVESAYHAFIQLIEQTTGSMLYVPGESVSVLSEILDNLALDKFIAYENSAMSTTHEKFLIQLRTEGVAVLRRMNAGYSADRKLSVTVKTFVNDAQKVAEAIWEELQ